MACEDILLELSAYLDGELSTAERAAVDAHLHTCQACRAALAEIKSVAAALSDSPRYNAPASLAGEVRRQLGAGEPPARPANKEATEVKERAAEYLRRPDIGLPRPTGVRSRLPWTPVLFGVAALLVLAVLVGIILPGLNENRNSASAPVNSNAPAKPALDSKSDAAKPESASGAALGVVALEKKAPSIGAPLEPVKELADGKDVQDKAPELRRSRGTSERNLQQDEALKLQEARKEAGEQKLKKAEPDDALKDLARRRLDREADLLVKEQTATAGKNGAELRRNEEVRAKGKGIEYDQAPPKPAIPGGAVPPAPAAKPKETVPLAEPQSAAPAAPAAPSGPGGAGGAGIAPAKRPSDMPQGKLEEQNQPSRKVADPEREPFAKREFERKPADKQVGGERSVDRAAGKAGLPETLKPEAPKAALRGAERGVLPLENHANKAGEKQAAETAKTAETAQTAEGAAKSAPRQAQPGERDAFDGGNFGARRPDAQTRREQGQAQPQSPAPAPTSPPGEAAAPAPRTGASGEFIAFQSADPEGLVRQLKALADASGARITETRADFAEKEKLETEEKKKNEDEARWQANAFKNARSMDLTITVPALGQEALVKEIRALQASGARALQGAKAKSADAAAPSSDAKADKTGKHTDDLNAQKPGAARELAAPIEIRVYIRVQAPGR